MVDGPRIEDYPSLSHVDRRDLADHPADSTGPLIGMHDKEADEKATEVYFRRTNVRDQADPVPVESVEDMNPHSRAEWYEPKILHQAKSPVADLVDLAAEKQKRIDVVKTLSLAACRADFGVSDFGLALTNVYMEAEDLCLKKHKDYGPKNISLSPGGPLNGLRVRLWDKMARINNLIDSGVEPANESLRDSFVDLLNYSAIAIMVIDGNWPSE